MLKDVDYDIVDGPESEDLSLVCRLPMQSTKGFVQSVKGKLPCETVSVKYALNTEIEMQRFYYSGTEGGYYR